MYFTTITTITIKYNYNIIITGNIINRQPPIKRKQTRMILFKDIVIEENLGDIYNCIFLRSQLEYNMIPNPRVIYSRYGNQYRSTFRKKL